MTPTTAPPSAPPCNLTALNDAERDYLRSLIEVDEMGENAPEGVDAGTLHERLAPMPEDAKAARRHALAQAALEALPLIASPEVLAAAEAHDRAEEAIEARAAAPKMLPPREVFMLISGERCRDMAASLEGVLDANKSQVANDGLLVYGRGHVHLEHLEAAVRSLRAAASSCGVRLEGW